MYHNLKNGKVDWSSGYFQWATSGLGSLQSFHLPIFPNTIPEKMLIQFDLKPLPKRREPLRIMKRKKWKK